MNTIAVVCLILCEGQATLETVEAKAVIGDQRGNKPAVSIPFGRMQVISAIGSVYAKDNPKSIKWKVTPELIDQRRWQPNPLEFSFVAEPLDEKRTPYVVTVILSVASGDTVDHAVVMIKCGEGDIPPPQPQPGPNPNPHPPDPTPTPDRALRLYVMDDVTRRESWVTKLLQDESYWQGLFDRGHKWQVFDVRSNEPVAKKIRESYPTLSKQPTLAVFSDTGTILAAFSLPRTTAELDTLIRGYTNR